MKKYRVFSALLALFILLGSLSAAVWAEPETAAEEPASDTASEQPEEGPEGENPVVYADYTALLTQGNYQAECKAALLIERNTNTVIYELNPNEQVYPASLTKIMTCLLAIEKCSELGKSLDDYVTVSSTAFAGLDDAGSTAGIQPGDRITVRELLYCMMLESANESCNIVAEYLAGSIDSYVGWMNARARELGCYDTHFANTHGLHDPNHYTTAHDLAIIAETAIANETFWEIVQKQVYEIKAEQYSGTRTLASTNYLIREAYPEYYYPKAKGVKTGYTSAAGRCLISTASDGNLDLLSVVLGTEDNDYAADGLRYRSFVETKRLFEYGFDNFEYALLLSTLDMTAQVAVTGAEDNRPEVLYPASDIVCLLPQGYDRDKIDISWKLYGGGTTLSAPLQKDQEVGTVTVTYDGVEIGSTPLLALRAVNAQTDAQQVVNSTLSWIGRYWWILPALLGLVVLLVLALIVRNAVIRQRRRAARRRRQQQRNGR